MKGFRKRWAVASDEEQSLPLQEQDPLTVSPVDAQDEELEAASSSWVDVSIALEPGADLEQDCDATVHRPKVAKKHGQTIGASTTPLQFDIRGAVEATIPLKITMPWEAGLLAHALGKPIEPYKPMTLTRTPASIPQVDNYALDGPKVISPGHAKLRSLRAGPPEDDRVRATHRFKVLLLLDPLATRAGRQMTDLAGLCSDDERASGILEDILAPKSSGTLVKRSWQTKHRRSVREKPACTTICKSSREIGAPAQPRPCWRPSASPMRSSASPR